MITERTIINALIIGASLILVPFIISQTLTYDYVPMIILSGGFLLLVAFFFFKETLCICPYLGLSVAGSLNFLPIPLDACTIACLLLIVYYITGYTLMGQKRVSLGNASFFWPIFVVTLIVLYHNHSLAFGRLGGGSEEGGKAAIMIYVFVLAYFCGINIKSPSVKFFSYIPLICVILTGLTGLPFLISSLVPSLAPYLYLFTDNVNLDAYIDSVQGSGDQGDTAISRIGSLGQFGSVLQVYLLCYYPIGSWWRPERWWVAGLSLCCLIFAVSSGYRNVLFSFAISMTLCTWCFYSWRAVVLPITVSLLMLIVLMASTSGILPIPVNKLPMIAQRSLSFLPFDWDQEALDSGASSNEFRKNIQKVYIDEYMSKNPAIGNGFTIDQAAFQEWQDAAKRGGSAADPEYIEAKIFIEGKLFHTGWISVYDAVGIIGSIAFVLLGWAEVSMAAKYIFDPKADRRSGLLPLHIWMFVNIATSMISFFTVFGDFGATFKNLCVYAIVLSHLSKLTKATDVIIDLPRRDGQPFSRAVGAHV